MIEALISGVCAAVVFFLVGFITEDKEAAVWMERRAGIALIIGLVAAILAYGSSRLRRNARNKRLESQGQRD